MSNPRYVYSAYEPPPAKKFRRHRISPWGKDILACIGLCVFLVMAIFYFQVAM